MHKRNPLFVAGFPYLLIFIGYYVILFLNDDSEFGIQSSAVFPFFGAMAMILVGVGYTFYWLATTARVLRRETNEKIPTAFLMIVPFVSYWWMWRYSKAVDAYTRGKLQTALTFILLLLLGPIGMGILQDTYNKKR